VVTGERQFHDLADLNFVPFHDQRGKRGYPGKGDPKEFVAEIQSPIKA
jgi:hypothetical protein